MNVCVNDQVYARCSDGIAYIGTVTQIDQIRNEVEVKFEEMVAFSIFFKVLNLK